MDEIGRLKKSCRDDVAMKQLYGGCPLEYIDIMRTIDGGRFFDEPNYPRVSFSIFCIFLHSFFFAGLWSSSNSNEKAECSRISI
jgi:hypothetical protein